MANYGKAAKTAYALLIGSTAWAMTQDEVKIDSRAEMHPQTVIKWLNKDDTRQAMLVLSFQILTSGGKFEPEFSVYALAKALSRERSMQNTLRNSILPALEAAGWIKWQRSDGSRDDANVIRLTPAGIKRMVDYLAHVEEQKDGLL